MRIVHTDYLIIGGGINGLTIAHEIKRQLPGLLIHVIDKEPNVGAHASGHHTGIVYAVADSLNTGDLQLTHQGNQLMRDFCTESEIAIHPLQHLLTAADSKARTRLEQWFEKAGAHSQSIAWHNGTKFGKYAAMVDVEGSFLVNPYEVVNKLRDKLFASGVDFHYGASLCKILPQNRIKTTANEIFVAEHVVNAAGAYALPVAQLFGAAGNYRTMAYKTAYKTYHTNKHITDATLLYDMKNDNPAFNRQTLVQKNRMLTGARVAPAFFNTQKGRAWQSRSGEFWHNLSTAWQLMWHNPLQIRSNVFNHWGTTFTKPFPKKLPFLSKDINYQQSRKIYGTLLWDSDRKQLITKSFSIQSGKHIHLLHPGTQGFTRSFALARHLVEKYFL